MKIYEEDGRFVLGLHPISTREQCARVGEILIEEFGAVPGDRFDAPYVMTVDMQIDGVGFTLSHDSQIGNHLQTSDAAGLPTLERVMAHFEVLLTPNQ